MAEHKADDTKIWRATKTMEDEISLQNDLDKLVEWTNIWLLKFNPDKCKVMKLGHNTPFQYSMEENGQTYLLQETTEEKDLGIYVCNNLKFGLQCSKAAKKSMSVLGLIRRHFRRIDKDDFKILNCYVRPHVENCIQAWSPYLVKDIKCLEQIQRRATKMVCGLANKTYEERIKAL